MNSTKFLKRHIIFLHPQDSQLNDLLHGVVMVTMLSKQSKQELKKKHDEMEVWREKSFLSVAAESKTSFDLKEMTKKVGIKQEKIEELENLVRELKETNIELGKDNDALTEKVEKKARKNHRAGHSCQKTCKNQHQTRR